MVTVSESVVALSALGQRLRTARIASNQSMAVFATRIGVSVPTLRDMERGAPTVQVGTWVNALWALDRLGDLDTVFAQRASLLDQARTARSQPRQRSYAPRGPRR